MKIWQWESLRQNAVMTALILAIVILVVVSIALIFGLISTESDFAREVKKMSEDLKDKILIEQGKVSREFTEKYKEAIKNLKEPEGKISGISKK